MTGSSPSLAHAFPRALLHESALDTSFDTSNVIPIYEPGEPNSCSTRHALRRRPRPPPVRPGARTRAHPSPERDDARSLIATGPPSKFHDGRDILLDYRTPNEVAETWENYEPLQKQAA